MHSEERWVAIPGFPNHDVSTHGNVRGWVTNSGRRMAEPVLFLPYICRGYRNVKLRHSGGRKAFRVSRAVLLAFCGPCPSGYQAAHLDGVRLHDALANLAWVTPKENASHKKRHGTYLTGMDTTPHRYPDLRPRGSKHGMAKLTESDVVEIKKRLAAGERRSVLRAEFQAAPTMIDKIAQGCGWSHVVDF